MEMETIGTIIIMGGLIYSGLWFLNGTLRKILNELKKLNNK